MSSLGGRHGEGGQACGWALLAVGIWHVQLLQQAAPEQWRLLLLRGLPASQRYAHATAPPAGPAAADWASQCLRMLTLQNGLTLHELAHHHEASGCLLAAAQPRLLWQRLSDWTAGMRRDACMHSCGAVPTHCGPTGSAAWAQPVGRCSRRPGWPAPPCTCSPLSPPPQIYPGSKRTHFKRIHERTRIPYDEMVVRLGCWHGCSLDGSQPGAASACVLLPLPNRLPSSAPVPLPGCVPTSPLLLCATHSFGTTCK